MHGIHGGFGAPGFEAGGLFPIFPMIVFWGLIAIGIILLVRYLKHGETSAGVKSSDSKAIGIVNERYARGEIDTAEFEEKIRALKEIDLS